MESNNHLSSITPYIRSLTNKESLSSTETERIFDLLFEADSDGYYWLAFTLALQTKTPTVDELFGLCLSIQKLLPDKIDVNDAIDLSGTGGRSIRTFNIGTTTAFVAAGAGVKVAKQGSTAVTGMSGSIDIAREFDIDLVTSGNEKLLKELYISPGITLTHNFLHSGKPNTRPAFLQQMRNIGLTFVSPFHFVGGIPTPFTLKHRLFGTSYPHYMKPIADLLQRFGYTRAMVISAEDGLDEISITSPTSVFEVRDNDILEYVILPEDMGIERAQLSSLETKSKSDNVISFLRVIYGAERGPKRSIVLANTAACIYLVDKVKTLREGVDIAAHSIDSGAASEKLEYLTEKIGNTDKLMKWKQEAGL